jgi:hypothetical protein
MNFTTLRLCTLLLSSFVLSGCLDVQLNGAVIDAQVIVTPLREPGNIVVSTTTDNEADGLALLASSRGETTSETQARWDNLNGLWHMLLMGNAHFSTSGFDDNTLYLVTASGGYDVDVDRDLKLDETPTPVQGDWHAIMTGTQLKSPFDARVSIVTEMAYQAVVNEIDQLSDDQLIDSLQAAAEQLVRDIDGDGSTTTEDLLSWSNFYNAEQDLVTEYSRILSVAEMVIQEPDTDGDGVSDSTDAFPNDASETADTDGDGAGDNTDAFPNDASETTDSDGDGAGDNTDAFPNDASETADADGDGVGDNADELPNDATETVDTDGDGVGDNIDIFPNDASETADTDGDGTGDNADAFPNYASDILDADGDGIGDNTDKYPLVLDPSMRLNDTGLTWGANYPTSNNSTCIGEAIAQQDCSYGRDATDNDYADGHAGFSFTKLDASGSDRPPSASSWSCVEDNVTGLIWEVKTDDGGIHDKDNTYRWGGVSAMQYGTEFHDDWDVLVNGSNTEALCGFDDWRVPTRIELVNLVNFDRANPSIDTEYFPNTSTNALWWSSSAHVAHSSYAWQVSFGNGSVHWSGSGRRYYKPVRLVRGGH